MLQATRDNILSRTTIGNFSSADLNGVVFEPVSGDLTLRDFARAHVSGTYTLNQIFCTASTAEASCSGSGTGPSVGPGCGTCVP